MTDLEDLMADLAARPSHQRWMKVARIEGQMMQRLRWPRWPVLKVVWTFWTSLMDEGIRGTCKPRWGALTFAYLNDGNKPTLWHTWRQVTHGHDDPYSGLYVDERGAPSSLAEARAWEREWDRGFSA